MATTYSTNLALSLPATGELAGTWGDVTNTNIGTLLEQAISGYVTQAITDGADTTITIPNGATGVARNMYIEMTGALTATRNLIVPANKKLYFIYNNTTGAFAVTVKVSGQTGVSVPNGTRLLLVCNGTDVVNGVSYTTSASSGANPSATIGLSTVNGLASTFMRSDGAPALSQGISPTWTAAHTFSNTVTLNGTVTGTGVTALFASPPAIGGTAAAAGTFTSVTTTGNIELGNASDTTLARIAAGRASLEGVEIGYRQIPVSATTSGTLAAAENGKSIPATGSVTINNSVHAAGDSFLIVNNSASSITITQGTITTMRLAGTTTTGSRTLAARGMATCFFLSATEVYVGGPGVT